MKVLLLCIFEKNHFIPAFGFRPIGVNTMMVDDCSWISNRYLRSGLGSGGDLGGVTGLTGGLRI